ncbi:hypothetical protein H5398_02175 [Tessaracoccus sp. MC1679]|uniref:Wzz/FepE/Etk N-terminal domain-containing protein n=1 Tax=Tessaracoccus sp. MC1679 TaxID=2760313 RepID=UPI0015FEC888|nr:Wzz/FepE/Etk N-terminal domain-containing protein [Tessaracoccus sp. MC1679]MBB1514784.1 hypothetical protein [Tessaracoccus sp. MC1679]
MQPSDDRVIDLWGFVKQVWRSRWVWLLIFTLVVVAGAVYTITRPTLFTATQQVLLAPALPKGEAEAIQQQTYASSMVVTVVALALDPRIAEPLSDKYVELEDPANLPAIASAELKTINLVEVSISGTDGQRAVALASDVAASLAENLEALTPQVEPHLRPTLVLVGTARVEPQGPGRTILLGITALAAVAVATIATAGWQRLGHGR